MGRKLGSTSLLLCSSLLGWVQRAASKRENLNYTIMGLDIMREKWHFWGCVGVGHGVAGHASMQVNGLVY